MVFEGAEATGHFSGGCIEEDIANHAVEVVRTGEPALLHYGSNGPWIDIRLACGAGMEILVERIDPDDPGIARLLELAAQRLRAISHSDGYCRTVEAYGGEQCRSFGREPLRLTLSHDPPWRLIVIGGDPAALAIAQLATQSGFATTILRPGGPQSPAPIAGAAYRNGDALAALEALVPDRWTAIAIALHESEMEHDLLRSLLASDAGYVGLMGAERRASTVRRRLERDGLERSRIQRLRAPMGAVRCGKSSWEIAVSVVAEIMEVRATAQLRIFVASEPVRRELCQ